MVHLTLEQVVEIFSDGACLGNPGPGGWAVLLRYGAHEKELYGHVSMTTNNRMEMMAALEGLKSLKKNSKVHVYTDSRYVQQGMTSWIYSWQKNKWKRGRNQNVENVDLWQQLLEAQKPHEVMWHWVKGHADHVENNRVDRLARHAALNAGDAKLS